MKKILLAIFLSSVAGCATPIPQVVALPIPERPVLPAIPGTEMQCLSDEAWSRLVQGRKLLLNHIETLENVIRSTH